MMPTKKMKAKTKRILICFTGIDGSGKTTLSKILVDALAEKGIKCTYVWRGWKQFDSFLLKPFAQGVKNLRHRGSAAAVSETDSAGGIHSSVYCYLILMDYLISTFTKIVVPLALGRNIISDRYVYDVIGGPLKNHSKMGKLILNLLPKPSLIFLVSLPEKTAFDRKDDVPSVEYLTKRKEIYLNMEKKFRMTTIDGSKKLDELKTIIVNESMKLIEQHQ